MNNFKTKKSLKNTISKKYFLRQRKILLFYSWFRLFFRILLIIFVYLLFFTNQFANFKKEIIDNIFYITNYLGFRLEKIYISGQKNSVLKEFLPDLEDNNYISIFAIDLKDIGKKIGQDKWIKKIEIKRNLPNNLQINIIERKAFAIWQVNREYFLIDDEGVVITKENLTEFAYLPHIVGENANLYAAQLMQNLQSSPLIKDKLISAVRYGNRRWDLNLQENITVKMPEDNYFFRAIDFITQLDKKNKLFGQNYRIIDLRDINKVYIRKF